MTTKIQKSFIIANYLANNFRFMTIKTLIQPTLRTRQKDKAAKKDLIYRKKPHLLPLNHTKQRQME